jgi:hypothetical protein
MSPHNDSQKKVNFGSELYLIGIERFFIYFVMPQMVLDLGNKICS